MCHATSAGRKAGSVSTNKSQFVDTLFTNKAYLSGLGRSCRPGGPGLSPIRGLSFCFNFRVTSPSVVSRLSFHRHHFLIFYRKFEMFGKSCKNTIRSVHRMLKVLSYYCCCVGLRLPQPTSNNLHRTLSHQTSPLPNIQLTKPLPYQFIPSQIL